MKARNPRILAFSPEKQKLKQIRHVPLVCSCYTGKLCLVSKKFLPEEHMHIVGQRCPWFCGSSHSPTPIWSPNPGCMREWSKGWMCQAFAESGCTSHHDCSEAHDCQLLISRVPIPEPPQSRRNKGSANRRDNALRGLLRVLLHCAPTHRHNPALGTPPHILPNRLIASPPMQP